MALKAFPRVKVRKDYNGKVVAIKRSYQVMMTLLYNDDVQSFSNHFKTRTWHFLEFPMVLLLSIKMEIIGTA